jgi:hypothetical protein
VLRARDSVGRVELDEVPLRVSVSPMPTMFAVTRDAMQRGRRGAPATWRKGGRGAAAHASCRGACPVGRPPHDGLAVVPRRPRDPMETVDEALQRLEATPGQTLIDALDEDRDVTQSSAWDPVRRDPERWLGAYVETMHEACQALVPLWRRSLGLLQREEERLNAAIDRGVPKSQIVNEILPARASTATPGRRAGAGAAAGVDAAPLSGGVEARLLGRELPCQPLAVVRDA